jgi:hypothetical protein
MKRGIFYHAGVLALLACSNVLASGFTMRAGRPVTVACDASEAEVVKVALELLDRDCRAVFSAPVVTDGEKGEIIVGTVGTSPRGCLNSCCDCGQTRCGPPCTR